MQRLGGPMGVLCLGVLHSGRPHLFQLQGFCIGCAVRLECPSHSEFQLWLLLILYISAQKDLPTPQFPAPNTAFHFVFLVPI